MTTAAIYARVSTQDQDVRRQLDEARAHLEQEGIEKIEEYPEVVSGKKALDERTVYDELWQDIGDGKFDRVVVHEISRLSRLGAAEIHEFIQHCLEHGAGVEALDVGLEIHVDDPDLQQTIYTMIANLMGDLAKIEHEQKLQRIRSGIRAAQRTGKWTGRPPRGFATDEDGYLQIVPEQFLHTREALARIERGESKRSVADETGIPLSTLRRLYEERHELYLGGKSDDERISTALDELRKLEDLRQDERGELEQRIRQIVREEQKNRL